MEVRNRKVRIRKPWLSFRKRVIFIVVGLAIGGLSLLFTSNMAHSLRDKEQYEIRLLAYAVGQNFSMNIEMNVNDPLSQHIISTQNNIPLILTDDKLRVIASHLVDEQVIKQPDRLRRELERLASTNDPVPITNHLGTFWIFYGESSLLKMLVYFPLIQIAVILIFAMFGYITFRSSKQDEQNRVWIGLAKETAHQLGTPTSSLLGWIEYLRGRGVSAEVTDEMGNDLRRLTKVAERFSKIGSETSLVPASVNEAVGSNVLYFESRVPRNVELRYNGLAIAPVRAMLNEALFEWVVENLLKNSLDALQGKGGIDVRISSDENWVHVDVTDTGRGIAKANFKRVFEPGFTTKTRGWGLGLSLSRRIIETYHKGRIGIVQSEPGKGTTMRITLRRVYV